jgi:protein-tyrosine kinase
MTGVQKLVTPRASEAPLSQSARPREGLVSSALVMVADPNGAPAEGIRALRTHLLAQHVHLGRRALAICSANAGVGKTFIATNLAVAFAQVGVKVALVDADIRSHNVESYFGGANPSTSLRSYLQNETSTFADAISPEIFPNLSVIFAGSGAANPQELLGGERFKDLVEFCLRDYELTIVDTPAANASTDARRISTLVGYSLIVAAKNSSRLADVHVLLDQITGDHGHAIGTVLNNA